VNNLRWVVINPTHHHGKKIPEYMMWSNDSFDNLSRLLNAPLYHILDEDIDETADAYFIANFDISLIDHEVEFAKRMKERGAKILAAYSQDVRFLHGQGLLSDSGTLWTKLAEVADVISSGINTNVKIFGRYQDKVIPMGEIIEDNDFASILYEERDIDLLTSGAIGEECLSFELEFLSLVKERFPDKKVVSCIHGCYGELVNKLRQKYPWIEFTTETFLPLLQRTKVYCNPELRPRPGRSLVECYYCRTPFIASDFMYHAKLCKEYTYSSSSIVDWVDTYEKLIKEDHRQIIVKMEERAIEDNFENVYERIMKEFNL
jgi:hypothetical protein